MIRWYSLATSGTKSVSVDWTNRLPSGSTVSSVSYEADPSSGLTFSGASVASNVSTVSVTADTTEREYKVKCSPTLSSGNISPVSVEIKVVKHKPAR